MEVFLEKELRAAGGGGGGGPRPTLFSSWEPCEHGAAVPFVKLLPRL